MEVELFNSASNCCSSLYCFALHADWCGVRLHAVHQRGEDPYIESEPWLEVRRVLMEPVREVRDVKISMHPRHTIEVGTARPAAVGAIIQARPALSVVLAWPHRDFDRLWTLAIAGRLTHAYLFFTKPRYNTGLVVNASFSTEAEQDIDLSEVTMRSLNSPHCEAMKRSHIAAFCRKGK